MFGEKTVIGMVGHNERPTLNLLVALTSYLVTSTKGVDNLLQPRLVSLIQELERINAEQHEGEDLQQQPSDPLERHIAALLGRLKLYREVAETYSNNKNDPRRAGAVGETLIKSRGQGVLEVTNILQTVLDKGAVSEPGAPHAEEEGCGMAGATAFDRSGCSVDLSDNLLIGSGGSSQVYLVDWRGRNGAAKVLNTTTPSDGRYEYHKKCFDEEVKILKKMRDADHIVQLYDHSDPKYILVMEYMPNGNLSSLLERCRADGKEELESVHRHRLEKEVAHGMAALHDGDIVHKDLKTENVLLDGMLRAKVSDFGISRPPNATSTLACHGTWRALAPESLPTGKGDVQRGKPADVYAYAILVWEIVTLGRAWSGDGQEECFRKVVSKKRPQLPKQASSLELTLLAACWQHDPNARPGFQDILGQMQAEGNHPASAAATCKRNSERWGLGYLFGIKERDPTSAAATFESERGEETQTDERRGGMTASADDAATTTSTTVLARLEEEMDRQRATLSAAVRAVEETEAEAARREEEAEIRTWYFSRDTADELHNGGRFRMEMTQTGAGGNKTEVLYIDTAKFSRPDSYIHTGFRILKGCPQEKRELDTFRCTRKPGSEQHVEITGMKQDTSALWFLGVGDDKRQIMSFVQPSLVRRFNRAAADWLKAPPRRSTWVVTPNREVNAAFAGFAWKDYYTNLRFEWSGAYGERIKIVRPVSAGNVEFVTWDDNLGEFCRDGNRDAAAVFMFKRLSPNTATPQL